MYIVYIKILNLIEPDYIILFTVFPLFAALHMEKRKWKIFYLSWSVMGTVLICFLTKMVSFY